MVESLPESLQNSVLDEIKVIITEKQDEVEWTRQYERKQKSLMSAAKKVREEIAAGKAEPMDYESL